MIPGGNGNLFRLFVVNVTIGGFGGSTDFNSTRLFGGLNLDMMVFGAGTGIGGGGTDMFGRTGVGGIGGTVIGTGTDIGGKTVDSGCGSGGGGGGGGCGCTPGVGAGKFGLCDMVTGQLLGTIAGFGELCTI